MTTPQNPLPDESARSEVGSQLIDEVRRGRMTRRELIRRATLLGVSLPAIGILLAACGGDDNAAAPAEPAATPEPAPAPAPEPAAPSGVDRAQANLDSFRAEVEWEAPGPAFDASAAADATIFYLPAATEAPIIQTIIGGMEEAIATVGANLVTFNAGGVPAEFDRGMSQAIGQNADVIIIEAIPPELIEAPIKEAKDKGIKIVTVDVHDESFPPALPEVDQAIALPYSQAGRLIADWVIVDSGGEANALIIETADFNAGKDVALAAMDEFAQLCPGCTVELDGVTFPDWGNLGTRAQSALTANPDLTYFAPVFDGMTLPMVPAIIQAGAEDRVKIATFNASPDVMKLLKDGQVIAADVGNSNTHHGWAQIDVAFRLIAGAAPIESEKIRLRVFDATNIDSINIDDPEETWMGPDFPQAFRDGYKQLWGVA